MPNRKNAKRNSYKRYRKMWHKNQQGHCIWCGAKCFTKLKDAEAYFDSIGDGWVSEYELNSSFAGADCLLPPGTPKRTKYLNLVAACVRCKAERDNRVWEPHPKVMALLSDELRQHVEENLLKLAEWNDEQTPLQSNRLSFRKKAESSDRK